MGNYYGGKSRRGCPVDFFSRVPTAVGAPLSPSPSPREGFFAPDFTLDTLDGGRSTLTELRGKIVVVNFWTTWCPPCREETPALEASYKAFKDSDVIIIGLNLTDQDTLKEVGAFAEEFGLTYPIFLDRDGSVGLAYQINGLPTTFFINREGIIRMVVVGGPMSETYVRSKIEVLLKEVK
ncbi:MAG TPA: TlpA disulfide reductase family protein [Anaerolineales bacterium]|nr:TlpA disulfide reductase family protein [Anaerolineales bacterium]